MPNNAEDYKIVIGTFINNKFVWHDVDSFDNLHDAYKAFKKYVQSQLKYSDEELKRVWDTGRLDIELRKGKKLLNWIGVYAKEVDRKADEEIEEEEQTKSAKDSYSPRVLRGISYEDLQREYDEIDATRKAGVPYDKERMMDIAHTMSILNDEGEGVHDSDEEEPLLRYRVIYDTEDEEDVVENVDVHGWLELKEYIASIKRGGAFNITVSEPTPLN